jgi:hypothetical protein
VEWSECRGKRLSNIISRYARIDNLKFAAVMAVWFIIFCYNLLVLLHIVVYVCVVVFGCVNCVLLLLSFCILIVMYNPFRLLINCVVLCTVCVYVRTVLYCTA